MGRSPRIGCDIMPRKDGRANLISIDKRSEEDKKRITSAGGKASAEKRRQMKAQKEIIKAMMMETVSARDVDGKRLDMTVADAIAAAMLRKAMSGDTKAYQLMMDMLGSSQSAERLRLEKDRLKLEEKRLEMAANTDEQSKEVVVRFVDIGEADE